MNAPKKGMDILHSPDRGEGSVLRVGTVTLDNMPAVAWYALSRQVTLQLRDMSGVASIELPDEKSIRIGIASEEHRDAVAGWLDEFANQYGYIEGPRKIEREDYTLTAGIPLASGENFVRVDNMSPLAQLTLRGLGGAATRGVDNQNPQGVVGGVIRVQRQTQLLGERTAFVHTDATPNMTTHIDEWLSSGIARTLEQRAKTEQSLKDAMLGRRRTRQPEQAPDSV